jgi:hypothetical protein
MHLIPRRFFALFPAIVLATIALQAQQPMIAGRVVRADSGAPIPGATVKLYVWFLYFRHNLLTDEPTPAATTTTDSNGEYRIEKVWDGNYVLSVTADGFLPNPLGGEWLSGPPRTLTAFASKPLRDLNVSMTAESAIRGTILDTDGKAVGAGVYVTLVRPAQPNQPATTTRTDAQGRFALEHLPSGSYFLCVNGPNGFGAPMPYRNPPKPGSDIPGLYQEAWYGGTSSAKGAQEIALAPGQNRDDIHLIVQPASLHTVTVHVSGPGDSQTESYFVTLFSKGSGFGPMPLVRGTYQFQNVPSGPYSIDAYALSGTANVSTPGPPQLSPHSAYLGRIRQQFDVSDADVTLNIHLPRYATVAGIIHVSGATSVPKNLRTGIQPLDRQLLFPPDAWLKDQEVFDNAGNFSQSVTPGKYIFGVPSGAVLEAAVCNGINVSEATPLVVGDGQQIKGCEVTLVSKNPAALTEPPPNPPLVIDPFLTGLWEMPLGQGAVGIRVIEIDRPQIHPPVMNVGPYQRTGSIPEGRLEEYNTFGINLMRWDGHHLIIDRTEDGKVHVDLIWDKATNSWTGSMQFANDRLQVVLKRPSTPAGAPGNAFVGIWRNDVGCLHIVQQPDGILAAWMDYLQPSQRSYGAPLALQQINPTQVLVDVDAFASGISGRNPPFTLSLSPDGQQLTGTSFWGKSDRVPGDSCPVSQ